MFLYQIYKKIIMKVILSLIILILSPDLSKGAGISIDAGLTPAENRLMFRTQLRYMERNNDPFTPRMEMKARMYPMVLAYGLRSNITIMARQAIIDRDMTMMGQSAGKSGFGDLLLLSKYRLFRINTPGYTLGIAPTLALEIPTGNDEFSSHTFDLQTGSFFSGRTRSWGMDLNITYLWNGVAKTGDNVTNPGNVFSIETAIAYQLSLGEDAELAFAPVFESSYQKILSDNLDGAEIENTGESVLLLSPGIKITRSSFIIEGLIQFPVWQKQTGVQTERDTGFLIGIRWMN